MNRFKKFAYKVSKNHTRTCWVLKCDIKKFFASIDQRTLLDILARYVPDVRINALITEVVGSFHSTETSKGLPLGNLTSQLLINVYMNEFDQFVKHALKTKYYIRYADDVVILSASRFNLDAVLLRIGEFLKIRLELTLHPDKVFVKTFASGVDFLGWVHFPDHRVLRTSTKRRMLKCAGWDFSKAERASYAGLLKHGNAWKLRMKIDEFQVS